MRRRAKSLPEFKVNGWLVEKRPNSFAEQYVWEARALDADGYLTARHGFSTKRAAFAFAEASIAPATRQDPLGTAICEILGC